MPAPKKRDLGDNWILQSDSKVLCKLCSKHAFGVSPIARGSVKKHLETAAHKEAEIAFQNEQSEQYEPNEDFDERIINDNEDFNASDQPQENFATLSHVDILFEDQLNTAPDVSRIMQRLIHSISHSDKDFTDDPFIFLADTFNEQDDGDAPAAWNDKRFVTEMGFGEEGVISQDGLDNTLSNVLQRLTMEGFAEDTVTGNHAHNVSVEDEWFPYPNKTFLILDAIDSLPRLPLSDSLMRLIIWTLDETGAKNVPSFSAFRKFQKKLRTRSNIATRLFESALGNKFYMNDLGSLIAKDFANPLVRPHLHFYPEESSDGISEVWHADKWHTFPNEYLTPMYIDQITGHHYYVNEFCQTKDGMVVVPKKWVVRKGLLCADSHPVLIDANVLHVQDDLLVNIIASDLQYNLPALVERGIVAETDSHIDHKEMPNPLRGLAGGEPLYTIFIDEWNDDVSGNKSKSYNKHINTYIANRCLPRKLLQQEFHVHFLGTSQFATTLEQNAAVKEMVVESHNCPIQAYDCLTQRSCRFRIFKSAAPADNPMQSELCSHIGSTGLKKCRRCDIGGNAEYIEKATGYHSLFSAGVQRTAKSTYDELLAQMKSATNGVKKRVSDRQTSSGVKDKVVQKFIDEIFKLSNGGEDGVSVSSDDLLRFVEDSGEKVINPSLSFPGYDPHVDTPVELLHTISLGTAKYIWHSSHTPWKEDQKHIFATRLQAANVDGLTIHPIRANYIMDYANSLIGRQFKTLIQLGVFQLHDIVSPELLSLWNALGELSALLWYPEIKDLEGYLADVDVCVANILDLFAILDPARIVNKIKLHLLTHIIQDIRRFGPLIGESTEVFECFNAIFRMCSIYSNKIAPSRDIAIQFTELEGAKQRITGGFWRDEEGNWVQAGYAAQLFFSSSVLLQGHLGWVVESPVAPGHVKCTAKQREAKNIKAIDALQASKALNINDVSHVTSWILATSAVARAGDMVKANSWVFVNSPLNMGETIVGQVLEIIQSSQSFKESYVVLDEFQISADRHPVFGMPTLRQRHNEQLIVLVKTTDILFSFNVQHDCVGAGCTNSGAHKVIQERIETDNFASHIEHKPLQSYIINLHSLHNPHLLRRVLPRTVWAPIQVIPPLERAAKHAEIAEILHQTQSKKRQSAKKRRQEKSKDLLLQAKELAAALDEDEEGVEADNDDARPPQRKKRQRV